MKALLRFGFLPLLLFLMAPPALLAQEKTDLPGAVREYYQDRNRAAAISTPQERTSLAGLPADAELPKRLGEVAELLRQLRSHDLEVDPGMIQPAPGDLAHVASAISKIVAVRQTGPDRIEVDLLVREVNAGHNFQLIRQYDSGKKTEPVHPSGFSSVTSRETHVWRLVEGRWMRHPAAFVLLNQPVH